jgi:hypothetical protein
MGNTVVQRLPETGSYQQVTCDYKSQKEAESTEGETNYLNKKMGATRG